MTEQSTPKNIEKTIIRRLLSFLAPYKSLLVIATIISLVSTSLGPLRPYLIRYGIDNYVSTSDINSLFLLCLVIVGVLLIHGTLQFTLTYMMQSVGQRVLNDIRVTVYSHIQRLPFKILDNTPVGRLITRATNDVEALNEVFSSGVVLIFSDILLILWIVGFMLSIDVKLTIVTITVVPLLLYSASVFRKKVRIVYNDIRTQIARMNSLLNEYISGIVTIQLFNQQKRQSDKFDEINVEHTRLQLKSINYYAVFFPVVEFLASLAISLVLWSAAGDKLEGTLTIGTLVSFIMYAEMFFRPIRDLTEKYNVFQSAVTASERIFSILDTPTDTWQVQKNQSKDSVSQRTQLEESNVPMIQFEKVTFGYNESTPILHDISFAVNKGEMLAIVGSTGSGKSTIINVLCGLYPYSQGSVYINSEELRTIEPTRHRSRIALVLQDVFLFSRSIAENIRIGRNEITDERIITTLKELGADFVESLPNSIQTQVLERGNTLSSGQKQLISFARACITDPDILILDEATSSIDTETEEQITHALEATVKGRTSVVIAHRLSTIVKANTIIVLHHGRIVESGNHNELLAKGGMYAKLYKTQFQHDSIVGA
jgi:ATP-binding cassette, subfamily B, multidrug efflux pump